MNWDDLGDSIGRLESDCGLPEGFCVNLLQEDDWSFVIKMHSLLETAVSQLLTNALGRNELADIFAALENEQHKDRKDRFRERSWPVAEAAPRFHPLAVRAPQPTRSPR
jgi:hypothetical protein